VGRGQDSTHRRRPSRLALLAVAGSLAMLVAGIAGGGCRLGRTRGRCLLRHQEAVKPSQGGQGSLSRWWCPVVRAQDAETTYGSMLPCEQAVVRWRSADAV